MPSRRKRPAAPRRAAGPTLAGLLALAALVVAGYLLGLFDPAGQPAAGSAPPPAATAAAGDGAIAAFFTTPELVYPDVARDRTPPAPEQALLADLDAATRSIDLAAFEYNLGSVAEALARAEARGVRVRVALDREVLAKPAMAKWAGEVEAAGIAVSWEESDAFLHSKFVVVDGRLVWTGSWNPTVNDTYRNNNNLLRITLPPVVDNYRAEFERMAGGAFGNDKRGDTPNPLLRAGDLAVETYFSPREQIRDHVVGWIGRARQSVDVLAFSFTDDAIGAALIARQRAGVPVRAVFEERNAQGVGSQYDRLRRNRVTVREDGNCYTMHHKVMIIDDRVVITGSYNFTGRAEDVNDENLLIIESPALAAAYRAEFDRVYRQAETPTRCG
jgi:phosphatidylserine/phosphatidylglycerophosphate/cardiolipin synthase-like enzyme